MKKLFGLFLFMLVVSISCTKGLQDDVDALQKPVPSGLILLEDTIHKVVKGEEFKIYFRVNPTGIELTKENLELDFIESDTYLQYTPESAKQKSTSKASYVASSEYYELVSLDADKNATGEILDGQWILTVKTKGEANFMNKSSFYLVLNYTDVTGQKRLISSSTKVNAQIFPTVDEGISIGYSKGQTFRGVLGYIQPYQILLTPRFYKNQEEDVWIYDWNLITQVNVVLPDANKDLFTVKQNLAEGYISLIPTEHEKWMAFEQSDDISVSSSAAVSLVDRAATEKNEPVNMNYYKSELDILLNVSATELNKLSTDEYLDVDVKEWYDKLGLTADYIMENHPLSWTSQGNHKFGDPVFSYLAIDNYQLQNILRIKRKSVVKSGDQVIETKTLQGYTTYVIENTIVNLNFYDVKIRIQINIVE